MPLFDELKRRNVFRVAIAYIVVAWLAMQVADVVLNNIASPDWVFPVLLLLLALGLPIAVFFAWAFELTPEGIKREHDVDRSKSITPSTGRKLDRIIIGVLAVAVVYFVADKWMFGDQRPTEDSPLSAREKSIAVLPFSNRSAVADDAFFVDGIHDDILTQLANLSGLDKVISRTTAERYRDTDKTLLQIGQELDVASILEGGVQRAGDRVRINMQLINAATDEHLWAATYDRELTVENLFAIQSEIAREVVTSLHSALSAADNDRLAAVPTDSLEAYEQFVLGRQELAKRTAESLARALAHFEKAIELDPDYALAYVGLADTIALQTEYAGKDLKASFEPRQAAIDRALSLNPGAGEAYAALGLLRGWQGNLEESEAAFLKAIELSPNYASSYHWYSNLLNTDERREESLQMIRKALSLDPSAPVHISNLSNRLRLLGRMEEAKAALLDGVKQNPDFPTFYSNMATLLHMQGRIGQAAAWLDRAVELNPSNLGDRGDQCFFQIELDDPVATQACLEKMRQDFPDLPESSFARLQSYIFQIRGEEQKAVDYLEKLDEEAPDENTKRALVGAYFANAQWSMARPIMEELAPQFFSNDEVTVSQQEVGLVIGVAASMREGDGWSQRAHDLAGKALETMRSMHRIRGVGYENSDVHAYAIRGELSQMIAALRQAIDDGWRIGWWGHRGRDYQLLLRERLLQPDQQAEWDSLISELEADIAAQRQWYADHKDDPLF